MIHIARKNWIGVLFSLAVVATGVYFSRFRLVVTETKAELPTPKEASRGYDTIVRVTVETRGRRPQWLPDAELKQANFRDDPQLVVEHEGQTESRPFKSLAWALWSPRSQHFSLTYPLKMAALPEGKVWLRDGVALFRSQTTQVSETTYHTGEPQQVSAPLHLNVLVRAGGVTKPPQVSREPKVRVLSVQSGAAPTHEMHRGTPVDAVARLVLEGGGPSRLWDVRRFEVVDSAGQKVDAYCNAHFESFSVLNAQESLRITVQWPRVRRDRGSLFIQGRIILNDNWPLLINIPIRDKAGRVITLAASAPSKARGVKIEPAPR